MGTRKLKTGNDQEMTRKRPGTLDSHYMDAKKHFGHAYFFRSTSGFPTGARCQVPGQGKFDFKTRLNFPSVGKSIKNGVFAM